MADIKSGRLGSDQYASNFKDKQLVLNELSAQLEAGRCLYCDNAPCTEACPSEIDVPGFINMIASGNRKGASRLILRQNIMGGTCARVCPTETLCEEVCVRNLQDQPPINISALQRFATDRIIEHDQDMFERSQSSGKKVAVVGAGPAGMACAHRLACKGHEVVIYEAAEKSGGLNTYGLAAYKIKSDFAQKEIHWILSIGGIDVHHGMRIGKDIQLEDLVKEFDAVFLSMGAGSAKHLDLEQENTEGCLDAIDYIADLRGEEQFDQLPVGRNVVVIGGGMTAIDIATQSKKLGAEHVALVYRRSQEAMAASKKEQEFAQTNGVTILCNAQPVKLLVQDRQLAAVRFEQTETINGKLRGRGETFDLPADMMFRAIGQTLVTDDLKNAGLDIDRGRIKVDENLCTSREGVWAGGDCVAGGQDLTVSAVQDGKLAAESIHQSMMKNSPEEN